MPGTEAGADEKETCIARTEACFTTVKTKANPVAIAKARAKVLQNTPERKAMFMVLCGVENSLIGSWGRDLSARIPEERPWGEEVEPGDDMPLCWR